MTAAILTVGGFLVETRREVDELQRAVLAEEIAKMQVLKTEWQHGGDTITVETPRNPGETSAAWAERHRVAVAEMKVEFPPDPE